MYGCGSSLSYLWTRILQDIDFKGFKFWFNTAGM